MPNPDDMQHEDCGHDPVPDPFRVGFPGPFTHHDVVVNGWRVPFLQAHMEDGDRVLVTLDRRLGVSLSAGEAERLLPFIADCIAVAQGYGAHPDRNSTSPLERGSYPKPERVVDIALG